MNEKNAFLREANEQAHAILRDTKEYADQTMKLFHKFQKDHVDTASVEKERQNLKKRMSKAEKGMSSKQQKQKPKKQLKPSDLSLGDTVKVLSLNLKGTVSSHPDSKGYLFVQMGIIRSKVHISDLELVDEPVITTPSMQRTGAGKIRMSKAASISTEINLLGKTVDEAVAELDKYLDDAYHRTHEIRPHCSRKRYRRPQKRCPQLPETPETCSFLPSRRIRRRRCRRNHRRI